MIISHKYKFIFIKTRKTAGTSLEVFLSQLCGEDDILTPIHPPVPPHEPRHYQGLFNPVAELKVKRGRAAVQTIKDLMTRQRFRNHMRASDVRLRIAPKVWQSYFKFCVERNPWEKTLSLYHHLKATGAETRTLDEFVNDGPTCLNYPLYTDRNGNVLVDQILRYESLSEELQRVFDQLGVPFTGSLSVRAKGGYRSDSRSYREILTPTQSSVIREAYRKEVELLGYEF